MQIQGGGAFPVEEVVSVTMGPVSAVSLLHKAQSLAPTCFRAPSRRRPAGLLRLLHRLPLRQGGSIPRGPDLVLLGPAVRLTASATRFVSVSPTTWQMPSLTQVIKTTSTTATGPASAAGTARHRRSSCRPLSSSANASTILATSLKCDMAAIKNRSTPSPPATSASTAAWSAAGSKPSVLAPTRPGQWPSRSSRR